MILKATSSPPNPRVPVSWDRYYDHAAIGDIGRRLQKAYPDRCRLGTIGKSHEGREIWLLTVTNFDAGDADRKPGMYIDGNIHANEVQGTEISLYTAWYLCEMADRVPWVDSLLDAKVFFIVPTSNPDGREAFIHGAYDPHSPRAGVVPRDTDGDGTVDEDAYDDLDGDGNITQMRRRNPNGRWVPSPIDPRIMIPADAEWLLTGTNALSNDRLACTVVAAVQVRHFQSAFVQKYALHGAQKADLVGAESMPDDIAFELALTSSR